MEYKPIAMILSIFIIWILILGTLATTGNAQNGNNTGTQTEEINNEHGCFDEFAQLETCIANPQNGAATQESSNTGNATQGANNPEPLQEMKPAFQITTKQLHNGLTEEKPAASTNVDCNRTVCVENAPHTGTTYVTAEQLNNGKKGFIYAVNGKTLPGMVPTDCSMQYKFISVKKDGVRYTICDTSTVTGPFFGPTKPGQIHGGLSGAQPFQNGK